MVDRPKLACLFLTFMGMLPKNNECYEILNLYINLEVLFFSLPITSIYHMLAFSKYLLSKKVKI